jgi:DNA mismatch endonuclease (patch repair protein)
MDRLTPERRSWLMSRVKSKNTTLEMAVRHLVFAMGFRYRLHDRRLPGRPDLVFAGRRKAIFINGCFWHGHEGCRYARLPKSNVEMWKAKVDRNRERDRASIAALKSSGWKVLTVWQCELKKKEILVKRLHGFLQNDDDFA